jgi:hypothetical protein
MKIINVKTNYGASPEIQMRNPSELFPDEKEELARELMASLHAEQIIRLFDQANLSTFQWESYLKKIGYAPMLKAQKVPELEVLTENGIYWNSSYNTFSPVNKNDHYYHQALKHQGKFFVEVKFTNQHPFAVDKKNLEAKDRKIKEEKAAKKKERALEKARKLLESE